MADALALDGPNQDMAVRRNLELRQGRGGVLPVQDEPQDGRELHAHIGKRAGSSLRCRLLSIAVYSVRCESGFWPDTRPTDR